MIERIFDETVKYVDRLEGPCRQDGRKERWLRIAWVKRKTKRTLRRGYRI
jgi:hypothetical protein